VEPGRILELRYLQEAPLEAGEYAREALPVGGRVQGPAVIREALSTTVVWPGQAAEVGPLGELVIEQR
jgi:N-methylhydantoinase A